MTERIQQIAERIREVRENSGLTPQSVADELQVPLSVYHQYETAESDIPISVLYEMARIFQVDLTDLLTGSSPKLHSFCLVKEGEGIEIERYKGYKFQSLAYNFVNKKIEPLLVLIEPEAARNSTIVLKA
jgi:transcriptional regulator with XRE-family HTH domain